MGSMRVWIGSLAHSLRKSESENDACSHGQRSCKNPQQFQFYLCSMSMFAFRSVEGFHAVCRRGADPHAETVPFL